MYKSPWSNRGKYEDRTRIRNTSKLLQSLVDCDNCASYFKIDESFAELNIQDVARVNLKKRSFSLLREKLNLANVKNNSIYQPLMYTAFGLQKPGVLFKSFLHSRPLNLWLCLPIFDAYSRKAVQGGSRKTTPTNFFILK